LNYRGDYSDDVNLTQTGIMTMIGPSVDSFGPDGSYGGRNYGQPRREMSNNPTNEDYLLQHYIHTISHNERRFGPMSRGPITTADISQLQEAISAYLSSMQPHMNNYQTLANALNNLYSGLSNGSNNQQLRVFLRPLARMREMLEKQRRIKQDVSYCLVELDDATKIGNCCNYFCN
jgi:hypothetical protein